MPTVSPRLAASGFALAGVLPALLFRRFWTLGSTIEMLAFVEKAFFDSSGVSKRVIDKGALLTCAQVEPCGAAASWLPNSRRKALNLLRRTDNLHLAA